MIKRYTLIPEIEWYRRQAYPYIKEEENKKKPEKSCTEAGCFVTDDAHVRTLYDLSCGVRNPANDD